MTNENDAPEQHHPGLDPAQTERLAIVAEEAGEVVQAACKVLRHGFQSRHPEGGPDNRQSLMREIGQFDAAVELMIGEGDLNLSRIIRCRRDKLRTVKPFLHYQSPAMIDKLAQQATLIDAEIARIRDERGEARMEAKDLRKRLDAANEEIDQYRKRLDVALAENEKLRQYPERLDVALAEIEKLRAREEPKLPEWFRDQFPESEHDRFFDTPLADMSREDLLVICRWFAGNSDFIDSAVAPELSPGIRPATEAESREHERNALRKAIECALADALRVYDGEKAVLIDEVVEYILAEANATLTDETELPELRAVKDPETVAVEREAEQKIEAAIERQGRAYIDHYRGVDHAVLDIASGALPVRIRFVNDLIVRYFYAERDMCWLRDGYLDPREPQNRIVIDRILREKTPLPSFIHNAPIA